MSKILLCLGMTERFIYSDEAGCFTFNRGHNVSTYFIIVTIDMVDWRPATLGLQGLRHDLISMGEVLGDYFHATTDTQAVRDAVFAEIMTYDFKVQATICEKAKAQPQVTASKARFYKTPWYYHCKIGLAPRMAYSSKVTLTAASLGSKKERIAFTTGLDDVMSQSLGATPYIVDFRPCQNDPCMQIADYCAWAIQRKWEREDLRSYNLIKTRITREYDLWEHGSKLHY
jgi:hypothetical protein